MRTVGLTGGIACGKSTVATILRGMGVPVTDADQASRAVVAPGSPGLARVVERFGEGILQPDGSLDRGTLGSIVFADPEARRELEAITHPLIRSHVLEWVLRQAQETLLGVILDQQLVDLAAGIAPSTRIEPARLPRPDQARLKEALRALEAIPMLLRDALG